MALAFRFDEDSFDRKGRDDEKLVGKVLAGAAVLSAALLVAAPAAQAGLLTTSNLGIVFTITAPVGVAGQDAGTLTATNYTFSGAFPLFNSTLEDASCSNAFTTCTLQSAVISITGNAGGSIGFYNTSGSASTLQAGSQVGAKLTVNTPFSTSIIATPATATVTDQACAANTSPNNLCLTLNVSATQTVGSGNITGANLATLVGAGNMVVPGDTANSSSLLSTLGNVSTLPNITADLTGYVVYTYNETVSSAPEPASMALVGVGIAGLAFIRRRRVK